MSTVLTALPAWTIVAGAGIGGVFAEEAVRRGAGLATTAGFGFLAGAIEEAPRRYFFVVLVAFLAATFLAGADLAAGAAFFAAVFLAGAAFLAVFFTALVLSADL